MEMSEKMSKQAKELSAGVDDLVDMTRETNVKLHNTFNQFLNLSSYQYVENVTSSTCRPHLTRAFTMKMKRSRRRKKKVQRRHKKLRRM